eukprot:1194702-Prorocentrum_minimum.AAC.6
MKSAVRKWMGLDVVDTLACKEQANFLADTMSQVDNRTLAGLVICPGGSQERTCSCNFQYLSCARCFSSSSLKKQSTG